MHDEIEDFLPITPVTQEFESDKQLIDFANSEPLKVIAHNLFCIAEQLNILIDLLSKMMKKDETEQRLRLNPNAKWIYSR